MVQRFDIYVSITIIGSTPLESPRGYPLSSQRLSTEMVYIRYILLNFTITEKNVIVINAKYLLFQVLVTLTDFGYTEYVQWLFI